MKLISLHRSDVMDLFGRLVPRPVLSAEHCSCMMPWPDGIPLPFLPAGVNCVASIQRDGTHGDDQEGPITPPAITPPPAKNPHAAALGRLGGLKGGHARALRLSPAKRREIARKAARARWRKQKS